MKWQAIFAFLLQSQMSMAWPRSLNVTRYFHSTEKGQLHYVIGGDLASGQAPLVMLHSDPRSSAEFKYIAQALKRPFVAVDFYGMGASEECKCEEEEFVKFPDYAASVNEILLKHSINKFVPFGCLKGTNSALALAELAGAGRVERIIEISPLMLPDSAIAYMKEKFIPSIMHPAIKQDGTHLLDVWKDSSAAPFGPDGKPDDVTEDLVANEEKTIDFLRCRNNGGRVRNQKAWVDFNSQIPASVKKVSRHAQFMILYGSRILASYVKYGMHPDFSMSQLSAALEGGKPYVNTTIEAGEGLLEQNTSHVASLIEKFLEPAVELV